jgi:peptidoglycan hydrolase-like protein with peptidoglycan-binding domain
MQRRSRRGPYIAGGLLLLILAVAGVGALLISSAHASLTGDANAIAKIGMPLGGGKIERVTVIGGREQSVVPITVRDDKIWPLKSIAANEKLKITVVVKRPGWISWLAGKTETLHLNMVTPVASLRSHYLTVKPHEQLMLHFKAPIQVYAYGHQGHLRRHVLATPEATVPLPRNTPAGSIFVSAQPRRWETSSDALVSWFPAGSKATVVANPGPGATISPTTPITLTFSKPVSKVLGSRRPAIGGAQGHWQTLNDHAIVFQPQSYGYGLATTVHVALPSDVRLVGGQQGLSSEGSWTVPGGSTTRLQQMLALLNYLPLNFDYAGKGVGLTPSDQLEAAVKPPAGHFTWRYANTPAALKGFWQPGAFGTVTKGAIMAFEDSNGMTPDGTPGPAVWKALIQAVLAGHKSSFGYTFVSVSEGSPETENTWHNGKTVESGLVNTGISSAPTAQGLFAVFEHAPSVTMSGTNPDGSTYSDPGVPYVSYFNGGDALHGFIRGSYGFPQSLGCVEMPYSEAGAVYPYTPIGTLVNVT